MTKIKSNPQFIDAIFAAKAEREKALEESAQENVTASIQEESVILAEENLRNTEIPEEHFEDTERIIAEAEEAAFRETDK